MDPYKVLGIKNDASPSEVKRAYKKLAMKLHPDKIGTDPRALEQMKLVNEAYAIVKNSGTRKTFDRLDDWEEEATAEDREKVWFEYSKQVENYYRKVQEYLEDELEKIRKEGDKLSNIELELKKKEAELEEKVKLVNSYAEKESDLRRREEAIKKKEKQLDDLLLYISKSYSLIVDVAQSSGSVND